MSKLPFKMDWYSCKNGLRRPDQVPTEARRLKGSALPLRPPRRLAGPRPAAPATARGAKKRRLVFDLVYFRSCLLPALQLDPAQSSPSETAFKVDPSRPSPAAAPPTPSRAGGGGRGWALSRTAARP
jgi:hypothetical protein